MTVLSDDQHSNVLDFVHRGRPDRVRSARESRELLFGYRTSLFGKRTAGRILRRSYVSDGMSRSKILRTKNERDAITGKTR